MPGSETFTPSVVQYEGQSFTDAIDQRNQAIVEAIQKDVAERGYNNTGEAPLRPYDQPPTTTQE